MNILLAAQASTPTTDLAMWSGIVGFALPPVVALVNSARWPGWVRAAVTLLTCVGVGGVTAVLDGSLTGARWGSAALIVTAAALGSYRAFWRPSGIAPAIEDATTPHRRP